MKLQKPVKMFGIWIRAEKGIGNVWRIDNLLTILFLKIIPIKLGFKPISFS